MNHQTRHQAKPEANHFSFGFLAGVLVGIALIYILGSKKGKKLVEYILVQGEELWGELLEDNPQLEERLEQGATTAIRSAAEITEKAKPVIAQKERLRNIGYKTATRFFRREGRPLA